MCVGMSEKHAGSAPLVLNFETGNVTPQWNAVFDDWFSAVATNVKDMPDSHADNGPRCLEPAPATVNQTTKLKNLTNICPANHTRHQG